MWLCPSMTCYWWSCACSYWNFPPTLSNWWTTILKALLRPSVSQFSRSVVSDSLRPHESQHARPPCLSPTPRVHPNPCPSGWWCHPTISSSAVPFSSCPQSLPASGSFPMGHLFAWDGQSPGVSASASVLPMNTHSTSLKPPCSCTLARLYNIWSSKYSSP